jgi:hypothetical protein
MACLRSSRISIQTLHILRNICNIDSLGGFLSNNSMNYEYGYIHSSDLE